MSKVHSEDSFSDGNHSVGSALDVKDDWMVSICLKDMYLQIPVHWNLVNICGLLLSGQSDNHPQFPSSR